MIDVALSWDGSDAEAEVIVEGVSLHGPYEDARRVFHEINRLRSVVARAEATSKNVIVALQNAMDEAERMGER